MGARKSFPHTLSCRLRSAADHLLTLPRVRCTMFGSRVFAFASLTAWNSLPDYLREAGDGQDLFRRHLKTFAFAPLKRFVQLWH